MCLKGADWQTAKTLIRLLFRKSALKKQGLIRVYAVCKDLSVQLPLIIEPPHDKTNKMAYALSEDSDQPGHPPSLIRVFAVHMEKAWDLSYPLSTSEDSNQTERMPRLI